MDTTAACDLGELEVGASATVSIDLVPTVAGVLQLDGGAFDPFNLDPDADNNTVSLALNVVAEESASGTPGAGGGVTTDSEADGATPTDPIESTVTLPVGATIGSITIAERPDAAPPPVGYGFAGQAIVITASASPPASASQPFVFQFLVDASIAPGSTSSSGTASRSRTAHRQTGARRPTPVWSCRSAHPATTRS